MILELKNRHGQKIVGDLEKPEGEIRGTCIIQHGWGSHRKKPTVQTIQNAFLELGFQTFNFDTTNSFGESDGEFEKSTLGSFAEDLHDVVKWIQDQNWFVGPLALSGHSKGGYAVAKYAEEYPNEVGYLVPVAPVVSGELSFEAYKEKDPEELEKWKRDGVLITKSREGDTKVKYWSQMEERLKHNLLPNAEMLTMPILLIVGSKDDLCPPDHIKILFDAIPAGNKTMKIIENAPHSFYEKSEQEACKQYIKDWLKTFFSLPKGDKMI
jgi:alpha-beta hydrolase superfamily lysophospholipase